MLTDLILEESYKAHEFLVTKSWIQSVWEHLDFFKLSLVLPYKYHLISSFTNNQGIMETACKSKLFNRKQLRLLNSVRISLKLIFLSDLLYLADKKIKVYYIRGKEDTQTKSSYK